MTAYHGLGEPPPPPPADALRWESVVDNRLDSQFKTDRLPVPLGWIYRTTHRSVSPNCVAMVFVPEKYRWTPPIDPDHG